MSPLLLLRRPARMSAYIAWVIVPIAVIVIVLLAIEWYRGRKREQEYGDD